LWEEAVGVAAPSEALFSQAGAEVGVVQVQPDGLQGVEAAVEAAREVQLRWDAKVAQAQAVVVAREQAGLLAHAKEVVEHA
jgi:hypothetical protein